MRTSRCIFYTVIGTILCLFYVFQQTEIVKMGYRITSAEKILEAALDRKTTLEYTLSTLESPLNLDKNLFLKDDGFEVADKFRIVKVGASNRALARTQGTVAAAPRKVDTLKRLAMSFLFSGKQAEAKTIK